MPYQIADVETRGPFARPFGFVYLSLNGAPAGRVGFGARPDDPDPLAVWSCAETPHNLKTADVIRIRAALKEALPHLGGSAR